MREMTCIGCPMGCAMLVKLENGEISVQGNACPRGEKYAKNEITCPKRMVTSTVRLLGGEICRLSVKTEAEVPKDMVMACMEAIRRVEIAAPVKIGCVVIENCAGTGVNVVATRSVGSAE